MATAPQTAVASIQSAGIVGQLSTFQSTGDAVVDSTFSEETVNGIDFGLMVVVGAAGGSKLPAANTDKLAGISVFTHDYARGVELDVNGLIAPKATFSILRIGRIFVGSLSAIALGDAVHVQCVAEAGHNVGTFRNDASVGKSLDISAFARWRSVASGTGLPVELDIDM